MATTTSPLIDNVPPEIRLQIFREVLRARGSLVKIRYRHWDGLSFNVSLLLVSKSINREATDAFFDVNSFSFDVLGDGLKKFFAPDTPRHSFVHVEFYLSFHRKSQHNDQLVISDRDPVVILEECIRLPRIKTYTMFYDGTVLTSYDGLRQDYTSSRLNTHPLVCIGIGQFELVREARPKVYLKHRELASIWPDIQASDLERALSDTFRDVVKTMATSNGIHFAEEFKGSLHKDFLRWIAYYESERKKGSFADPSSVHLRPLLHTSAVPLMSSSLPTTLQLKDLVPGVHDPELLEWASDLLALNFAPYAISGDHYEEYW